MTLRSRSKPRSQNSVKFDLPPPFVLDINSDEEFLSFFELCVILLYLFLQKNFTNQTFIYFLQ